MRGLLSLIVMAGVLSACSGVGPVRSPSSALPQTKTSSGISFKFQTVDDPASTVNRVNGIDLLGNIVGTIGNGNPSSPYASYISAPPYTTFQNETYSGAQGTVATSISTAAGQATVAGWVIHPPQLPGIWSFVQINGLWTIFRDRKGGKGPTSLTEILGVNDAGFGVGYFKNAYGYFIPVVVNIPTEKFNVLKPPAYSNAEGTGINNVGDITGWEQGSSGTVGFFEQVGRYYTFTYPGATATYALGINTKDQIVGYYVDSSNADHGFILTNPKGGGGQTWQSVDEPSGARGTVITDINDNDEICGYYVDASRVQHGFVATTN